MFDMYTVYLNICEFDYLCVYYLTYIYIPFGLQTQDFPRGLCAIGQLVKKDGIPAATTQLILKLNLNLNARFKSAIRLPQYCIANPEKNEAQATQIEIESKYEFLIQNPNYESTQKPQPPGDSIPGFESWTNDPSKQPKPNLSVDRKM